MSEATRHDVERELNRVVDRLGSMPLSRAEAAAPQVMSCADTLVQASRALGVPIPDDARVPEVGPTALGAMIAVLGRDALEAARAPSDLSALLDALTALRRSLP